MSETIAVGQAAPGHAPATLAPRKGGRILVDALRIERADRIFCVPGESYLEVLDALHDAPEIQLVVCRHEGGAANMAEADGKLTGSPGIAFVTRGPGATHASVGIHTAFHDSTPMLVFVGQVERGVRGREAFQEIDVVRMFEPLAKWCVEINSAARIPEIIHKAFRLATSGRCGPVVISLPEDVLSEVVEVRDVPRSEPTQAAPEKSDIERLRTALSSAQRPILVVGGSGWTPAAAADLVSFAEKQQLPVVSSFRRQDIVANRHPNYAGHLSVATSRALAARIRNADLLIALGARLSDVSTGAYTLVTAPYPLQRLIHVHPDPDELGRVYRADIAITSSMPKIAAMLEGTNPIEAPPWSGWLSEMRSEYVATTDPKGVKPQGAVDLAAVVAHVDTRLPAGSIVTNGAGNYTVWLHRFFRYCAGRTQLAPTSGAMGYGLPAAVAAKLRHPDRAVVCFAGDGCFLMYPQEIATAVQHGAAIVIIVINNAMYGTIRMHQERRFPGRVSGTDMVNPDFVAFAKSFGAHAEAVETTGAFAPAFERALAAERPALIDVRVDPQQLTPDFRLAPLTQS